MKKFGRIIGAVVLAIIASVFVNACTLLSFGGLAHLIQNLSFLNVIAFSIILGFAGSIVFTLAALILYGLWYLSRGSKLIGIIVTIILLNSFINDFALLISGIANGPAIASAIEMIKEEAGKFYMAGAIITLIVDFACYVVCSIACFVNPEE